MPKRRPQKVLIAEDEGWEEPALYWERAKGLVKVCSGIAKIARTGLDGIRGGLLGSAYAFRSSPKGG
jgi:hypothetical protein